MGFYTTTTLQLKNRENYLHVIEFAKQCKHEDVEFKATPEKFELEWSGRNEVGGWAEVLAESVVAQFPDIDFRISSFCDMGFDLKYGVSEQGKIRWLELSDDVKEMFEWGIDVDPYKGPTPENFEQLRQFRRKRVQEMIDLGVHIAPDTWPPLPEHYDEERKIQSEKYEK